MKKIFQLLSLLLLSATVMAQTTPTVNVTTQVLPPYSTYLPDYVNSSNKVILTLLSYTTVNVKLKATITGDNGITVTTSPNFRPPTPLQLTAYQNKMLTGLDLKSYLDFNAIVVTGINKNDLFRGSGIPEGNYRLCIQVLDYNTGVALSSEEPLGCSNTFSIEQITPPQLIAPRCDEPVMAGNIQNLVFSWLPPQGAPAGSQYKLKIVELIPATRNPNEAMNSATAPAFFETTTASFSYMYGPAQPLLKKGMKYAWRVTILPPNLGGRGGTPLNFQNKGNSEVCSFEYKGTEVMPPTPQSSIQLVTPIGRKKLSRGIEFDFVWKATKNPLVKEYEVQFTNAINDKKYIKEWNEISEALFLQQYNYSTFSAQLGSSKTMPANYTQDRGKYAWRVVGLDAKKNIVEKSELGLFEITDLQSEDRIKIVSPNNGETIAGGVNLKYAWTASKNKLVKEYALQWAYVKSKSEVSEKLFSDTDLNGSIGFFKETSFAMKTQVDQEERMMAWRVIGLSNGQVVDSSLPSLVEFVKDKSDLANLKALKFNDYTIEITKISSIDKDAYAGQGKILLWENGPQVNVWFKDLKVRPIVYMPKTKSYVYAVINGTIDMPANKAFEYKKNVMDLATHPESEGVFEVEFTQLKLTANLKGEEGTNNPVYVVKEDLGVNEARLKSKWYTNFFKWNVGANSTNEQYVFETADDGAPVKISYKDKIEGKLVYKPQKMENLLNSGIEVSFDAMLGVGMSIKGLEAKSILNGKITVPKANSANAVIKIEAGGPSLTLGKLEIPFKEKTNLNFQHKFDKPLNWKINSEGSVFANIAETYVHLSAEGALDDKFKKYAYGLNFDKFGVDVHMPKKSASDKSSVINLSFDNIYNNGKGYTNNKKGENVVQSKVDIGGFTAKMSKSEFLLKNNKLAMLLLNGTIYVPFLNDWAPLNMFVDNAKIQEANISFDYQKKYYLVKNQSGSVAYITISLGRFDKNAIVISPSLTITDGGSKGFETTDMSMCEMYINPSGAVSYDTNFSLNSESVCEGSKKWARYYRFNFGIDKMKIKRTSIANESDFLFSGDVNLGPNIATQSKKEAGFKYKSVPPDPNKATGDLYIHDLENKNSALAFAPVSKGGPSENAHYISNLDNSISVSDDGKGINAGYEDGAQKFGGGFKIVTNDPKWGNYFQLEGKYEAKEPTAKELEAKLILGKKAKMNSSFTYWFFEFKQKGMVVVPIIPAILEMHGFGGKAYYHMKPTYDNIGTITDLNPDTSISLGISAEAYVRTAYDNGKTLHGKAQVVTEFSGWSINGIDYYIKADAIAENSNSTGMLQARLNGELNWVDKYINGKGQIWGKVKDIVCVNDGEANEDSIFFQFGGGEFKIDVGTETVPITAEVLCGSGMKMGVWFNLSKSSIGLGMKQSYDSGWKGLNLGIASAQGKLTSNFSAGVHVNYSPFQATGTASFSGRAYGKGCVDLYVYSGCIKGSAGVSATLKATMPNPVEFEGSVVCDVHKYIPNFTLYAKWSSVSGFSIWV